MDFLSLILGFIGDENIVKAMNTLKHRKLKIGNDTIENVEDLERKLMNVDDY